MPSFKYVIELSDQDKAKLMGIVKKGNSPARTILRANILLASDKRNDKYMTVSEIADAYRTTPTTVQTVRTSYCEKGLEATINRKKRETPPIPAKVTGEVEAHVIALACGQPPEGYSKWTLRLLADRTVELGYIDSISHVTVSTILKKTNLSLTWRSAGIFCRNTMPLLWSRWRMCLRYTVAHMTKTIPLFAWMKSRSSFLPTSAKDSAPKRTAFHMRTTSIFATAQQVFSFLQSLWPAGDMPTPRREGLLRIGQSK